MARSYLYVIPDVITYFTQGIFGEMPRFIQNFCDGFMQEIDKVFTINTIRIGVPTCML